MTVEERLEDLADQCWVFESWSEHPSGGTVYYVKLTCGVQARGMVKFGSDTFDYALQMAYDHVMNKWGRVEKNE